MRSNPAPSYGTSASKIKQEALGNDIRVSMGINVTVPIRIFDSDGGFSVQNIPEKALEVNRKSGKRKLNDITKEHLDFMSDAMSRAGIDSARKASTVITHVGGMSRINSEWEYVKSSAIEDWREISGETIPDSELSKLKINFMQELLRPSNTLPTGADANKYWGDIFGKISDVYEAESAEPKRQQVEIDKIESGKYLAEDMKTIQEQYGVVFDILDLAASSFGYSGGLDDQKAWKYQYVNDVTLSVDSGRLVGLLSNTQIHDLVGILNTLEKDDRGRVINLDKSEAYVKFQESILDTVKTDAGAMKHQGSNVPKIMHDAEEAAKRQQAKYDAQIGRFAASQAEKFSANPLDEEDENNDIY